MELELLPFQFRLLEPIFERVFIADSYASRKGKGTHAALDHSNPQEEVQHWFPGDDLFTAVERRRGLPIGNQTSQFFANVYLDPFDHWVKETLRARHYVRSMDDFSCSATTRAG